MNSIISGTSNNISSITGSVDNSFIIGTNNSLSGISNSIIAGSYITKNTTSPILSTLALGYANVIDAQGIIYGCLNTGSAIGTTGLVALGARSTSNTTIILSTDPNDSGTRFYIENNCVYKVNISLIGSASPSVATQVWDASGIIRNSSGTVSILSAFTFTSFFTNVLFGSTVVSVVANNTNKSMDLTINTGTASTINWVAQVRYEKVYV